MKPKLKRLQVLPNVITAFSLTCGIFVILKMALVPTVDVQLLVMMAAILIFAAIADALDGAIARVMHAESEFGGLFDSLTDAVTFGVAPSVIVIKTLSLTEGTDFSYLLTTAAMIYTVCGVLRLVRYNVMHLQMKDDAELIAASKKNFTGLPIPAAAGAAVSMNLMLQTPPFNAWVATGGTVHVVLMVCVLLLIGYLMISRWRFPSLKTLRFRVGSFQAVFLSVIIAVIIFYGILHHFAISLFIICWGYILLASVLSFVRMTTGRRSKTLEDFEPEPEEELDN